MTRMYFRACNLELAVQATAPPGEAGAGHGIRRGVAKRGPRPGPIISTVPAVALALLALHSGNSTYLCEGNREDCDCGPPPKLFQAKIPKHYLLDPPNLHIFRNKQSVEK